ncbi:hypothetical protein [Caldisericum sp.]|uniref:hypothetical protein n=1 Tax=Caldisericum sp. TaxID=2499687 RepID=UPI003D0C15CC
MKKLLTLKKGENSRKNNFKISPWVIRGAKYRNRGNKRLASNFPKRKRILINRRGKSPPSTIRKGASPFLTYPQGKIIILGIVEGAIYCPLKIIVISSEARYLLCLY